MNTIAIPLVLPPSITMQAAAAAAKRLRGRLICRRQMPSRQLRLFIELEAAQ